LISSHSIDDLAAKLTIGDGPLRDKDALVIVIDRRAVIPVDQHRSILHEWDGGRLSSLHGRSPIRHELSGL
jgi:hypothetical protein